MYDLCFSGVRWDVVIFYGAGAGVYFALQRQKDFKKSRPKKKSALPKRTPKGNTKFFKL